MKLIIQIPAFNEEATIAQALRDLPKKLDGITAIETLVIDDGSSDKTVDAARKAGANHILQLKTHRGLSAAFVAGIDAALRLGADIIVNTDADNQYAASDLARLVTPIVKGAAEVVIGDRQVAQSPHMSALKKALQRLGSWAVGKASGLSVGDVTSGFRAFSRDAAMQINVFNPFTYTLETVIQAGNRNLGVQSVAVRTNAPTRPSRLYRGMGTYLRKSIATIFRIYTVYRPLKTFFAIGSLLMLCGVALGARFLVYFAEGDRGGHVQSLILAAVFLVTGFQTWLIALLADLVAVNRRLTEDVLIRVKRLESPERATRRDARPQQQQPREQQPREQQPPREQQQQPQRDARPPRPQREPRREAPAAAAAEAQPAQAPTQWVWLLDEEKLNERAKGASASAPPAPSASPAPPAETAAREDEDDDAGAGDDTAPSPNPRRRRRRRGGARQHTEQLPGNRGKHLAGEEE
ncbi:MAG: glycosyltransferase family 2 protein [Acidobacteria bacterium]|nr:glycosyltransferase family 2 protein [Acidobacteriota bacterium]MBV9478793.1 glycosyltransferase family 2 protein [Acidobacteriota bacterium]